jgi:uncharacterized protein CbrC (UPF0167 family)
MGTPFFAASARRQNLIEPLVVPICLGGAAQDIDHVPCHEWKDRLAAVFLGATFFGTELTPIFTLWCAADGAKLVLYASRCSILPRATAKKFSSIMSNRVCASLKNEPGAFCARFIAFGS